MGTLVKTNGNLIPAFPSFFDDFFTRDLFDWSGRESGLRDSLPAVNIFEKDASFELEVAAPGMKKEDFTVELENDTLVISAELETKNEEKDESGHYTRREFSYRNFKRSFSLPERTVRGEDISATYRDGVLYVSIPKSEEARTKPKRIIEIS